MAKISDIITRRGEDFEVPQSLRDIRDTTQGLTDERYTNNVIDVLGGIDKAPWWISSDKDVTYAYTPIDPTLEYFMQRLGIKDTEGKKAKDHLVDDYKNKWKEWKATIEQDKNLGKRGWDTFKRLWRSAVYDKAEEETKRLRNEVVNDGSVPNMLIKMAFPRTTERIANTGDFDDKDIAKDMALDIGENVLMAVPGTAYAKLGSKLIPSKVLGAGAELLNTLKGSKSPLVAAAGYGLGAVPNTLGNTVVPLVSEVADDVAYDVGEGMDDRASFSTGDVALGGAINQAVNRGLIRSIAPYIDKYSGEVRSMGTRKLRNFFENLGKSKSELGKDFVTETRRTVNSPVVRTFNEGTKVTPGELESLKGGYNNIPEGVGVEDYLSADMVNRVIGLIDNGEIRMQTGEKIAKEIAKSNKRAAKEIYDLSNKSAMDARKSVRNGKLLDAVYFQSEKDALDKLVKGRNLGGLRPQQIIDGVPFVVDVPVERATTPNVVENVFNNNPELYNYAYWKNPTRLDRIGDFINQAVPSLVINKAGKSSYAPEMTRVLKDDIEANRKASKTEAKKAGIAKILNAGTKSGALSENDRKWLELVRQNPDIVTTGYTGGSAKDADDFKMWLLMGGNDLLRGTEAHRPIWEVK